MTALKLTVASLVAASTVLACGGAPSSDPTADPGVEVEIDEVETAWGYTLLSLYGCPAAYPVNRCNPYGDCTCWSY